MSSKHCEQSSDCIGPSPAPSPPRRQRCWRFEGATVHVAYSRCCLTTSNHLLYCHSSLALNNLWLSIVSYTESSLTLNHILLAVISCSQRCLSLNHFTLRHRLLSTLSFYIPFFFLSFFLLYLTLNPLFLATVSSTSLRSSS